MIIEILVARKQMNLTQQEVADKVGISRVFYSLIENGHKKPSIETLIKIQDVLGIDKLDIRKFNN